MTDRLIARLENQPPEGKTAELYDRGGPSVELYVDGIHGMGSSELTVKINWYTRGLDLVESDNVERRELACRMVMSIPVFFSVVEFLGPAAEELRKRLGATGSVPSPVANQK